MTPQRSLATRRALLCFALGPLLLAQPPAHSEDIDPLFHDYNRPGVPGASVVVIRNGKILYRRAYGMADLEARVAATPATNYRLASLTKQFTAMAILILAERKRLSLDDPLTKFFPEYPPYGKAITVRHLLQHTSGLKPYEDLMPPGRTTQLKDIDVLHLLEQQTAADFPPGSQWRYSNTGYAHLALIVEKASGLRFADFLQKNIFHPLHMEGTVAYQEGISTVRNRAYGYTARGDAFARTDQSLTSAVLGDGGIYSSVNDLYLWDQALYTAKLVGPETLRQAFTPGTLNDGARTSYGFGWELGEYRGRKTVRHSGSTIGFRTEILRVPSEKFTIIVLTNRSNPDPAPIANQIAAIYLP